MTEKNQPKKAYKKAKRAHIAPWKTLSILFLVVALVCGILTPVIGLFDNTLGMFVGGSFYELENEDANAGDYYFTAATDAHNAVNNILRAKGCDVDGNAELTWKWTEETLDTTTYSVSANGTPITNQLSVGDPTCTRAAIRMSAGSAEATGRVPSPPRR